MPLRKFGYILDECIPDNTSMSAHFEMLIVCAVLQMFLTDLQMHTYFKFIVVSESYNATISTMLVA